MYIWGNKTYQAMVILYGIDTSCIKKLEFLALSSFSILDNEIARLNNIIAEKDKIIAEKERLLKSKKKLA